MNDVEAVPHDVASDPLEYPSGELDTLIGKFKYTVFHDNAYFNSDKSTINRVEYRVTFHLHLTQEGTFEYKQGSQYGYLRIQRSQWDSYNKSSGSDSAYKKVREELIPFISKWMDANPLLLQQGQRAYLSKARQHVEDQLAALEAARAEAMSDAQAVAAFSVAFEGGGRVDWACVDAIQGKKHI